MVNPCSGCSAPCCTNYLVTCTSFDVLRIAKKINRNPEEFADFHPAIILNLDWDSVLQFHNGLDIPDYSILTLKSRPCCFLKNNKCSIHDSAPLVCKRYPFDREGNMVARHCSLFSRAIFHVKGPQAPLIINEIKHYHRIVKEWNQRKEDKTKCMEFLMKRSEEFKDYPD